LKTATYLFLEFMPDEIEILELQCFHRILCEKILHFPLRYYTIYNFPFKFLLAVFQKVFFAIVARKD
jgi:hypothetical protein